MAIEGTLKEFGIHDVFQLLDLSRKSGLLIVKSELRSDEGTVYFDGGRVVHAALRSKPSAIEDALVQAGKISVEDLERARGLLEQHANGMALTDVLVEVGVLSARDLERLFKQQLEAAVFELMSWREGFFSFEERDVLDAPKDSSPPVPTESLLMEGARRIDEWSRIADKVPNLSVVPALAQVSPDHESQLDLLPHEWEVLTMIDGQRDLKTIAGFLGRPEFEIAKIAYGLATTGVIEVRKPVRLSASIAAAAPHVSPAIERARTLIGEGQQAEALRELRRAAQQNPNTPELHLELGFIAVKMGDFATAKASWEQFIKLVPGDPAAQRVRGALDGLLRMLAAIELHG